MENGNLDWYRNNIERFKNSKCRMDREYGAYLERYFDPNEWSVDGKLYKYRMETSPMPYNVYFMG